MLGFVRAAHSPLAIEIAIAAIVFVDAKARITQGAFVVAIHAVVEFLIDLSARAVGFGFAAVRAEIAVVKIMKIVAAAAAGPINVIAGGHDSFSGLLLAHTI